MSERSRDLAVAGAFLVFIGGLVTIGWVTREPGPEFAREAVAEMRGLPVGTPAPGFALPRINGDTARLASLRGRPVIVNIWATWCAPCVREMPSLQRVYERYRGQGLEVVAVAVDDRPGERQPDGRIEGLVSRFVDEYGLTFPIALDPTGATERQFGTEYLPTTVLIDRDGVIRVTEVGGREWDQEPYLGMVRSLVEEE